MMTPKHLQLLAISLVIAILILFQSLLPIFPDHRLSGLENSLYGLLGSFNNGISDNSSPSQVVVVNIGAESREKLGWPIPRKYISELLSGLKAKGHPYVLSTAWWGLLKEKEEAHSRLIQSVKEYEKYIGSSVYFQIDEEPDDFQEEVLLPRVLLTNHNSLPSELPLFELVFQESNELVNAQLAYGTGQVFGDEQTVYCLRTFIDSAAADGSLVLPSAFAWAASFASGTKLSTYHNSTAKNFNYSARNLTTKTSGLYPRICLPSTQIDSNAYLSKAQLKTIELTDLVEKPLDEWPSFKGFSVVLADTDQSKKYIGPGPQGSVVKEPILLSRFLDSYLRGTSINKPISSGLSRVEIISVLLCILSLFLVFKGSAITVLAVASFGVLSYWLLAFYNFYVDQLSIIEPKIFILTHGIFIIYIGYFSSLKFLLLRKKVAFSEELKQCLSSVNQLEEFEAAIYGLLDKNFKKSEIRIANFHETLFEQAESTEKFLSESDSFANAQKIKYTDQQVKTSKLNLEGRRLIHSHGEDLGLIEFKIVFDPFEAAGKQDYLTTLTTELTHQWYRIFMAKKQQVQAFQIILEQTRNNLLSQFLPNSLVERFSGGSIQENLKRVMKPVPRKVAILQADVRGFSNMAANLPAIEVIKILRNLFGPVVDQAQLVAQVKLIGDCIFLFIEDSPKYEYFSVCDLGLNICLQLVNSIEENAKKGISDYNLQFGIALNYGQCICGNLSSENCIDYTVIGTEVNKTARIEEVTKKPSIQARVGKNAVLLTDEAYQELSLYKGLKATELPIKEMGATIRSFEDEDIKIHFISAEETQKLLTKSGRLEEWLSKSANTKSA